MSAANKHKFFVDFSDVYEQDTKDFYPSKPGINPFVEAKMKMDIRESHFMSVGFGYRFFAYQIAKMHDIYATTGHVYKINTNIFWTFGADMGIRLIKYTDIEYNPGNLSGPLLDDYNIGYKMQAHKNTIIIRLNFGLGYMF